MAYRSDATNLVSGQTGSGSNILEFNRQTRSQTLVSHQAATLSGKITGTTTSDSWISPQYDLAVKDHTVSDLTAYGAKAHSDVTSQLQKLTPG